MILKPGIRLSPSFLDWGLAWIGPLQYVRDTHALF